MTLKKLLYISLSFPVIAGLINFYFWQTLPETTLIPMSYSSDEGFGNYKAKAQALLLWPLLCIIFPFLIKIFPHVPAHRIKWFGIKETWEGKTHEDFAPLLATVWIFMFFILTAMQIIFALNPKT